MENSDVNREIVPTSNAGVYQDAEIVLTPWTASGNFTNDKYKKLIEEFGVQAITSDLLTRFEKLTGHQPHRLLRRGLFFAHRHFEEILDDFEQGKRIYIYTGRGPTSEALHLGHIIPMEFTVWLQQVFNAFVVFQMADDEKYWFKKVKFDHVYNLGFENAKDVIALGFNPDKTFIFSNRDYSRNESYQKVAFDIMKHAKMNDVRKIFGLDESNCVGQMIWPIYQSTAAFSEAFEDIFGKASQMRCLVAYAIDQDPYFRLARDVAPKLNYKKPSSLMCRFLPALGGDSKMSSTVDNTIFMNDDTVTVKNKIKKYAFSGGQKTIELHRKLGADVESDICIQWLRYFLESDKQLAELEKKYASGELLTSEIKNVTSQIISDLLTLHQTKKKLVTPEIIKTFYDASKKY